MKNKFFCLLLLGFTSCDMWVKSDLGSAETLADTSLDAPETIQGQINQLHHQFADVWDEITLYADLCSDALTLHALDSPAAEQTELEQRKIAFANVLTSRQYNQLAQLRFYADQLAERMERSPASTAVLMQGRGLFYGYWYGAVARYAYAAYFGLKEQQGGATIDASPFIPSSVLLDQALQRLDKALLQAGSEYERRLVNAFKTRIYWLLGSRVQALTTAQLAFIIEDRPFNAFYSNDLPNLWWSAGKRMVLADRLVGASQAQAGENLRIPVSESVVGIQRLYRSAHYPEKASPIPFITWQELEYIRAELEFESNTTTALSRINAVRRSYGLTNLQTINLNVILEERDKTLFGMGLRLLDQRRLKRWHSTQGTWEYFPISQAERLKNPNLK